MPARRSPRSSCRGCSVRASRRAETLERYTPDNYSEENVEQAKADRAILNKAAKELNDRRIQIEREWNAPLQEFKGIVGDTVKMIADGSAKIDAVVKGVESKAKAEKRASILSLDHKSRRQLCSV